MGIIAETWLVDETVQLNVQRLTGLHRLTGALTFGVPPRGAALLFRDCRSLHGCFMRRPLEAVFVADDGAVLAVATLRPWQVRSCRGAAHSLELAPAECERLGIAPGKFLRKISHRGV